MRPAEGNRAGIRPRHGATGYGGAHRGVTVSSFGQFGCRQWSLQIHMAAQNDHRNAAHAELSRDQRVFAREHSR